MSLVSVKSGKCIRAPRASRSVRLTALAAVIKPMPRYHVAFCLSVILSKPRSPICRRKTVPFTNRSPLLSAQVL